MSTFSMCVAVYASICFGFCLGFIVSAAFRDTDRDDEPFPTDWRH